VRIISGFAFLSLVGFVLMQPKIGHATMSDIKAVLPREAYEESRLDEAAFARLHKVLSVTETLDLTNSVTRYGAVDFIDQRKNAEHVWSENKPQLEKLRRLLEIGSLTVHPAVTANSGRIYDHETSNSSVPGLVEGLGFLGYELAAGGDFRSAEEAIDLHLMLSSSMHIAGGDLYDYRNTSRYLRDTYYKIRQVAHLPGCPTSVIRHFLKQLVKPPDSDSLLDRCFVGDFKENILPSLLDPIKIGHVLEPSGGSYSQPAMNSNISREADLVGTYEPVETARLFGEMFSICRKNISQSLAHYDNSLERLWLQVGANLQIDSSSTDQNEISHGWSKFLFRFQMDNTKNSIGRYAFINRSSPYARDLIVSRCHLRSDRDTTRVLLASILYRDNHSGKLPNSLSDLVPTYLSSVPIDPYNGKLMRYSRKREIAWFGDSDITEAGGSTKSPTESGLIYGISLAASSQKPRLILRPME